MSNVSKKEPIIMTDEKKEGKKNPDGSPDETDEIIDEMREEGLPVDAKDDEEDESTAGQSEDDLDEAEDAVKKGKKKKDGDSEEDDSDDDSEEDDSEDDDDDKKGEDDDEDEDEDEDDDKGNRSRPIKTIPAWQHKKELKQQEKRIRKELSGAADSVTKSGEDVDEDSDEVKSIVDEFGLDEERGPKFVKAIINAAAKRGKGVSEDDMRKMKATLADQEEDRMFGKELDKVTSHIRKVMPDISSADMDKVKTKVKNLAYTEQYQKYSLEDIVTLNVNSLTPKTKKKSGEKGRSTGATRNVESYDLDNPDSIPWADLSDEEFDKVSEALEKRSPKNKILRKGERIN